MLYSLNILIFLISVTHANHAVFCEITNSSWPQSKKYLKTCDIVSITNSLKLEPMVLELTDRSWNDYEKWQWKNVFAVTVKMTVNIIPLKIENYFPNLEAINACCNDLQEIQDGTFQGLKQLKALYLGYNQINQIENGAFNDQILLEILYLNHNKLTSIGKLMFQNLYELKEIYLHNNLIQNIDSDMFKTNLNLEYITVCDERCPIGVYYGMHGLKNIKYFEDLINFELKENLKETKENFKKCEVKLMISQNNTDELNSRFENYSDASENYTTHKSKSTFLKDLHFLQLLREYLDEQLVLIATIFLFYFVIDLSVALIYVLCLHF